MPASFSSRSARAVTGLFLVAVAFAMVLRAHLGLGPWHVVHQGVAQRLEISIGSATIAVGILWFAGSLLLRERPGVATLGSVVVSGVFVDLVLPLVPTPHLLGMRLGFLAGGLVVMSFGAAWYMSAALGAAPIDAVMTGIFRRVPFTLRSVRISMEVVGLVLGWWAGGEVGIGCVVIGLGIGPGMQAWLVVLGAMPAKRDAGAAELEPVAA